MTAEPPLVATSCPLIPAEPPRLSAELSAELSGPRVQPRLTLLLLMLVASLAAAAGPLVHR